jgi:hypothetical protein
MKEVTLSTGQTATIRSKDELTEGQSRKIGIARSRGAAVFNKYGVSAEGSLGIPPADMDKLSDEDWANISGFEDTLILVLTESLDGQPLAPVTDLPKVTYDALNAVCSAEYAGVQVSTEGPDEKIDPKVEAAESTPSSSEEVQI